MDIAKCTEDGVIYTAFNFSNLLMDDLERKRRFLQCPNCGGAAFFRHASPIGRTACFGARPHADGCELAAYENTSLENVTGSDRLQIPGGRIVVDFRYGAPSLSNFYDGSGRAPSSGHDGNHERPHAHIYRRRLGSLLRTLIEYPAFSSSDQIVEIEGRGQMAAGDFFVPLQYARGEYSGYYRGYFGVISDAKMAMDKSLWFNSGGNDNISFCLDSRYVDAFIQRYGINDLEDIAGAYILVFGTPRVSQNGKLHCVIDGPENMALRLT